MVDLTDGHLNQLTDDGDNITKSYEELSHPHLYGTYHLLRERDYQHLPAEDRVENEKQAADQLDELDIPYADILDEGEDEDGRPYLRFERLDGPNLLSYADETDDLDELYGIVRDRAEDIADVHDQDCSFYDPGPENTVVVDDTPYSIDNEYFVTDAADHHKKRDLKRFMMSAASLDDETYQTMRDALEDGYGDELDSLDHLHAGLKGSILFLSWGDRDASTNALTNTATTIRERVDDKLRKSDIF